MHRELGARVVNIVATRLTRCGAPVVVNVVTMGMDGDGWGSIGNCGTDRDGWGQCYTTICYTTIFKGIGYADWLC